MRAEGCREWRESLGAFVLDQLPADEHAAVQAHVEHCEDCRGALALLEPVAEALLLADPAHVDAAPASPRDPSATGTKEEAMAPRSAPRCGRARRGRSVCGRAGAPSSRGLRSGAVQPESAKRTIPPSAPTYATRPPGASVTGEKLLL